MKSLIVKIHPDDNVAIAVDKLFAGDTITAFGIIMKTVTDIKAGHKVALTDINVGGYIIKYGHPIGRAATDIKQGEWVHTHNLSTALGGIIDYKYNPKRPVNESCKIDRSFQGFLRRNGDIGIRNDIWIINTVGCINNTARLIAEEARIKFKDYTHSILTFSHPFGCSQLGDDLLNTQKILAGLARHPNAGGVLILGLGCENNNIPLFKTVLGDYDEESTRFLNVQDAGDEITEGVSLVGELIINASRQYRVTSDLSRLKIGLKCGGSDAFSGITANPLAGKISDIVASCDGTVILSEVPEMFGAETALMERCVSLEVFEKTVGLINTFKDYFTGYGQVIYENPSPGNKEGGITTLEEKSLGCILKGGSAIVTDVLGYGECAGTRGLNLLYGPGNDLVSTTALAASGAHIVLFTTGRGTPLGSPVPTIKISSNNRLFQKKPRWIDYNAGKLLYDGNIEAASIELLDYIIQVANGIERTRNEVSGFHEIGILKDGVCL